MNETLSSVAFPSSFLLLPRVNLHIQIAWRLHLMTTSTKLIVVSALLGTLGLASVLSFAHASQSKMSVATMPEHRNSRQISQNGDRETNDDAQETAEDQKASVKLRSLAKITAQQAQEVAEAAQGGKAQNVTLENDDGNLVYAVMIAKQEVKVDAGNGHILYTEAMNHEDQKTDVSYPKSSIQITESQGGDGDGEMNDDG
jgi:uncharacterized membrane protein YkoI